MYIIYLYFTSSCNSFDFDFDSSFIIVAIVIRVVIITSGLYHHNNYYGCRYNFANFLQIVEHRHLYNFQFNYSRSYLKNIYIHEINI